MECSPYCLSVSGRWTGARLLPPPGSNEVDTSFLGQNGNRKKLGKNKRLKYDVEYHNLMQKCPGFNWKYLPYQEPRNLKLNEKDSIDIDARTIVERF